MTVYQALKISKTDYELLVYSLWLQWCCKKSFSMAQCQMLMCHNALFKWWQENLKLIEKEFMIDIMPYHTNISRVDAKTLYRKHTEKLKLYYSNPLITKAITNVPKRKDKKDG